MFATKKQTTDISIFNAGESNFLDQANIISTSTIGDLFGPPPPPPLPPSLSVVVCLRALVCVNDVDSSATNG
jgi:hypothetical protein